HYGFCGYSCSCPIIRAQQAAGNISRKGFKSLHPPPVTVPWAFIHLEGAGRGRLRGPCPITAQRPHPAPPGGETVPARTQVSWPPRQAVVKNPVDRWTVRRLEGSALPTGRAISRCGRQIPRAWDRNPVRKPAASVWAREPFSQS